jgi:cysteine-rich repeat protein
MREDANEECDDGNMVSTDECIMCKDAFCGDGHVRAGSLEQCDDGNMADGDGCSAMCLIE